MRRKKNKKYKKAILNLILYIILLSILIYSGIKIFKWYKDKTNNNKIVEQIKSTVIVEENNEDGNENGYTVDFNKLKEQNNETIAWLKINNTNVEYPVVKGTNNSFYLNHSFDKSKNSAGWIFADYKNKFDNTDKNIDYLIFVKYFFIYLLYYFFAWQTSENDIIFKKLYLFHFFYVKI